MSPLLHPQDWLSQTIVDAAEKIMDYRGRTPKKLGMGWGGGNIPAISARNVRMGHIDFTEQYYVGSNALYKRWMTNGDMERGDVLITTEAPLGNVAAILDDKKYILSQRTVLIRPRPDSFDKTFFLKVLQSPGFQRLLHENATGSTALGIQRKRLEQLPVITPPLPEQRRIGRVLKDIDDLIATLDKLIAKKQGIKQGMIQQLITGKARLPGFIKPWCQVRLGDVLTVRHGKSQRTVESPGGRYPILATGGQIGWARSPLYSRPSVLIGRKGTIDRPQYQATPFWTVDTLFYTEIDASADARYLYYVFLTVDWRSMNEASGVPSLSSRRVEGVEVKLPNIEEQRAIRSVLDDVDLELLRLRIRLDKARAIKQGVMQELLTGRTRLPSEEAS